MINNLWFPWEDQGSLTFLISGLTQKDRMELLKSSERVDKKWLKKGSGGFMESIDLNRYNEMLIDKVVIDCQGLKNKHLLEVYDTTGDKKDSWKFKADGKAETEIIFEKSVKDELIKHHSAAFVEYVNAAINAIDEANRKEKALELKN